jgi:hypothetical protein
MNRPKDIRRRGLHGTRGAITPPTDAERVLGQIERGEVRAGPEAAREIARRQERQYGDVWKR